MSQKNNSIDSSSDDNADFLTKVNKIHDETSENMNLNAPQTQQSLNDFQEVEDLLLKEQ